MRVYIAGPYTGGDTIINVRNAVEVGDKVARARHTPFIPHLYHFWHFLCPGDYELWMRLDFEWLETCDVLLRLPGESSGADREVARAHELGIPVFEGVSDEFWRHLETGIRPTPHIDSIFKDGPLALAKLEQVRGIMQVNDDGEYVVSWRQP